MTTTVPRGFVHRAAIAEVFLTGWTQLDDTTFSITAQWPRGHSFFTQVEGHYDPLLAAETIRQVGALLAHTAFHVPLDHKFLLWDLDYTVVPDRLLVGTAPADLHISVTCSNVQRRGSKVVGLHYDATIHHEGEPIATGGATFTCTSPEAYRRLRGARLAESALPPAPVPPVAPQDVSRSSGFDVVLGLTDRPQCWQLRADTTHPVLFDHLVDHIPGMVLLEAARQAVHALRSNSDALLPIAMESTFSRYVEFDRPCWIEADLVIGDPAELGEAIRVTGHQSGELAFASTVTTARVGTKLVA